MSYPHLVVSTISSRLVLKRSASSVSPTPSLPYTGAVSKNVMPASSAACKRPRWSATCPHQSLASVHVPNPTSETTSSDVPKRR